jgi:hypothetical protein
LEELRGGLKEEHRRRWARRRSRNHEVLWRLWHKRGTLWGSGAIERLENSIREDLWRETLIVPEDLLEAELRQNIKQFGHIASYGLGEWIGEPVREPSVPYPDWDDDDLPGTEQGEYAPYTSTENEDKPDFDLKSAFDRYETFTEEQEKEEEDRKNLVKTVWWGDL